ncbi:MAG: hypothetical protein ACREOP_11060 [Thermodesulfobacteriota bacterium]
MKMTDRNPGGTAIFGVERYDRSYDTCMLESIEEATKKFHIGSERLDWSGYDWARHVIDTDQPVQKALELVTDIPEMYIPLIVAEAKLKVDKAFKDFKPYDTYSKKGNIWVNTGRTAIMKLATGLGSQQAFNNATADLGVGNSATAPAASQTALLGGSTLYKAMNGGYPTTAAAQAFNVQATFGDAEAKFNWLEEAFRNGSTALILWNRANTNLGDKTSVTETWVLTGSITW